MELSPPHLFLTGGNIGEGVETLVQVRGHVPIDVATNNVELTL